MIIGIQKATVFPEPVFAWAIKSLLSRLKGKLFCCIDVSFVYDKESRFAKNSFDKFNCENFSTKMIKPFIVFFYYIKTIKYFMRKFSYFSIFLKR